MMLAGFTTAFAWGLRLTCRLPRLLLIGGLAAGLCVLLASKEVGAGHWDRPTDAWFDLWLLLDASLLTYVLPLIALVTIAQGFREEISRQTLVYHLVRPISRSTLFLARFLSGVVPATLLGTLALAATCVASGKPLPIHVWLSLPLTALAAALTVGAVYYVVTSLFRGGMIVALIYTFVFEPLFASQSGSMQKLSIMFHVRGVHHGITDVFFREQSENIRLALEPKGVDFERLVWRDPSALADIAEKVAYDPLSTALLTCGLIAVVALGYGAWRTAHRDFPLKG